MSSAVTEAAGSYSIWVMPKGSLFTQLQAQITDIGQEYNGPHFEPHATLMGDICRSEAEVLHTAEQLAADLQPYDLTFEDVNHGNTFHQCVYIRIKPDQDVLEAALETRTAYGGNASALYMPHVSLLYADLEKPRREELVERLQTKLIFSSESPLKERGFTADA